MTVDLSTLKVGDIIEIDNNEYEKVYDIKPRKDTIFPYLICTKHFNREYSKCGKTSRVDTLRITKIIQQAEDYDRTIVTDEALEQTSKEISDIFNKYIKNPLESKIKIDYTDIINNLYLEKHALPITVENIARISYLNSGIKFYEKLKKEQIEKDLEAASELASSRGLETVEEDIGEFFKDNLIPKSVNEYNPSTAKTDTGKDRLDLLPYAGLAAAAKAFEYGMGQYGHNNYQQAKSYRPFLAAALRHLGKLVDGEENDQDSGLNHICHALACLMMAEQIKSQGKPMNDPETMPKFGKRNQPKGDE